MVPLVPPPSIAFLQLHFLLQPHPAHRQPAGMGVVRSYYWSVKHLLSGEEESVCSLENILNLVHHKVGVTVRFLVVDTSPI